MYPCCICGAPVLGLEGQDALLDTYFLLGEREDGQALADEIFGECHQTCLVSSGWGAFWANRKIHNFVNIRGYRIVFENQNFILMRDRFEELTGMIRHDGAACWFDDDQFARREKTEEGWLIPVEDEINLDISDKKELAGSWIEAVERQGFVPLRTVIEQLGAWSRLLVPESVEGGILSPSETSDAKDARAGFFSMRAAYHIHVADEVAEEIGAWLKRRNGRKRRFPEG